MPSENFRHKILLSENAMMKFFCMNYLELKLTLTKIKQITVHYLLLNIATAFKKDGQARELFTLSSVKKGNGGQLQLCKCMLHNLTAMLVLQY